MSELLGLDAFREMIAKRLDVLYRQREQQAYTIDPCYGELITELGRLILRGGKRLRPYLTYLSYRGLGGEDDSAIIDLAASQELMHNFLMIHDDVFDHDLMRYGGLNVAGRYRLNLPKNLSVAARNHLASTMAVIGGDVTIGFGLSSIIESDFPDALKLEALRRLERMIFEVAGGEVLDVMIPTFDLNEVTEERLLKVNQYKTASYSFEAPMQIGAIMAGGNDSVAVAITRFAIPLGIAFQHADDLLGIYGNESEIGKSVLSDLREGKRTLLMVKGMELADEHGKKALHNYLGDRRAGYSALAKVRTILDESGARSYLEDRARAEVDLALENLHQIGFSSVVTAEIKRIAQFTIQRRT
jgi:geranylgeranyl diphosphate synthase type II